MEFFVFLSVAKKELEIFMTMTAICIKYVNIALAKNEILIKYQFSFILVLLVVPI